VPYLSIIRISITVASGQVNVAMIALRTSGFLFRSATRAVLLFPSHECRVECSSFKEAPITLPASRSEHVPLGASERSACYDHTSSNRKRFLTHKMARITSNVHFRCSRIHSSIVSCTAMGREYSGIVANFTVRDVPM
jgi:hypothetical protein